MSSHRFRCPKCGEELVAELQNGYDLGWVAVRLPDGRILGVPEVPEGLK